MKAFIINLSKISSSYNSALELQKDLLKIGIESELFEGTYGSDAVKIFQEENRTVHSINFKGNDIDDRGISKSLRPGVMGCFYSHYRLWKKCVELNEPIMIFEDDVKIIRPYASVEFSEVCITVLGAKKNRKYAHYLEDFNNEPKAEAYHNASMPGTPGYMISPKGASKLLKCYKKTFLPSDNAINQQVVKIQIHNKLIGVANLEKKSLTKASTFWENFNE